MKSDVLKINDYNYMNELSEKIQKLELEKQDRVIKSLEEQEKKRQYKLIIKGFLDEPYDDNNGNQNELNKTSESKKSNSLVKLSARMVNKPVNTPYRLAKLN